MPPRLDPFARLVLAVLRRLLPGASADDVVGDLVEHYGRQRHGRKRWLLRQAADLAWGFSWRWSAPALRRPHWDGWVSDARYAARALLRSRGFAVTAAASLTLGVGLTATAFSVIDGVLLQPLPYDDADAIVRIRDASPGRRPDLDEVPRSLLQTWQARTRTLEAIGAYARSDADLTVEGEPFVGVRVEVSDGFFDVMRADPLHGRLLGPADAAPDAPRVAVLSHAFWRRAGQGDPAIVGRRLLVGDASVEIVGVLDESFAWPADDVALYVPGRWSSPGTPGVTRAFFGPPIEVVARLAQGATTRDVEREAAVLAGPTTGSGGNTTPALSFDVLRLQDDLSRDVRPALVVLLASVICVLAIVCVNLTNLLLARGTVRQREIAVRAALGASRWGMMRPLVLEGLLLAGAGGAAGLALAATLVRSLPLAGSIDPMLASQVSVDGRVIAFTVAVTAGIGVVISALPAWQAPSAGIKDMVRGSHVRLVPGGAVRAERLRSVLVVLQVALAVVLAVAAGLLSRSLVTLLTVDLGFEPAPVLTAQVRLPAAGGSTYGWRAGFYEEFAARLAAHPGVEAAGFSSSLPMRETFSLTALRIEGLPPADPGVPARAHREAVTPGYFAAIGLDVIDGRPLMPADLATAERVLVVNEAFADRFLAGRPAVGQRVEQFGHWHRVVGVVRSKRHAGLRSGVRPEMYVPLAQAPPDVVQQSGAGVALRTSGDPSALVPFVRATLREFQPLAALDEAGPLAARVWASTAEPRVYASVMGAFAALAMLTAFIGLYGVLSYTVERRRVEIGVRRALGATGRDVSTLVLGRGLRLVAVAMPLGAAGAAAGVSLLRNLLFGIEPADPVTFAAVLIGVPFVALAACAWPARRAARIEPLEALREL